MNRTGIISVLFVVMILSSTSCTSGIPQQEYDRVSNEMRTAQNQLASLQDKLAEAESLQAQYEELNSRNTALESEFDAMQNRYKELSAEYDELNIKYDAIQTEYETLNAKHQELGTEYEELSKRYETVLREAVEIAEEDVEQALFELINKDRVDNELDILPWRESLHKRAKENSIYLATNKGLLYPEYERRWREVYWATGYNSADKIAEATHLAWQNRNEYEEHFLWTYLDFGAVGVYKSEDIFYITYLGDHIRG